MDRSARIACAAVCMVLAVGHIIAAARSAPVQRPGEAARFAVHEHVRLAATELIGRAVMQAPAGQPLGSVQEIVFDARNGRLRYALVRHYGDDTAFSAGHLRPAGRRLLLEAAQVPPGQANPGVQGRDARTAWPAVQASSLLGREFMDRERHRPGEIVDLQVNLAAGRVQYALVRLRDEYRVGAPDLRRVSIDALELRRPL